MTQPNGASAQQPWTINRLLDWTRQHFESHGLDEPRLAAEILLAHALGCKRIELYTRFDQVPAADPLASFRELVKQAARHTPISYLVGHKEFYSLSFAVEPAVLIPRPETEILVQRVIELARERVGETVRILDVGTGSGCITIALLKNLPTAEAVATDVVPAALVVAATNAERHGVADRIRLLEADRLDLPPDAVPTGGFDVLVCNPPYIAADEMAGLDANVRDHEPRAALTDEADGLSFYRSLADAGPGVLRAGGALFLEVGETQAAAVREIFAETPGWTHVATWKDTTGPHERVLRFDRA